jgi:hypothetical protein
MNTKKGNQKSDGIPIFDDVITNISAENVIFHHFLEFFALRWKQPQRPWKKRDFKTGLGLLLGP